MPTLPPRTPPHESLIDETVDESFPASDPPQLTERRTHNPRTAPEAPPRSPRDQIERGQQPSIGNQGTMPQSRIQEETVNVSDLGAVTLRFDGDFRNLHLYLGEEGMALDAKALDKLIAVLSAKRAQMQE